MDIAEEFAGTDRLQMKSWHVMFLARGKSGPFPIRGEAVAGVDGKIGVTLLMVDAGNGDRNVTSASAVFRRVALTQSPASAPINTGSPVNSGVSADLFLCKANLAPDRCIDIPGERIGERGHINSGGA